MTTTLQAQHLTLEEQRRHKASADRANATERYRVLVARNDSPEPGDLAELEALLPVLGIDGTTYDADVRDYKKARDEKIQTLTAGQLKDLAIERVAEENEVARLFRLYITEMVADFDKDWLPWLFDQVTRGGAAKYSGTDRQRLEQRKQAAFVNFNHREGIHKMHLENYRKIVSGNPRVFGASE
jgi:hypothetical protein